MTGYIRVAEECRDAASAPKMCVSGKPLHFVASQRLDLKMVARFMSKIQVDQNTGCYLWTGTTTKKDGYGVFQMSRPGRQRKAHRIAYQLFKGHIPEGLQIDHDCHSRDRLCNAARRCQHRRCVNPAHLVVVTPRVNALLGRGITAAYAQATHCHRGHEFTRENTRVYRGGRTCRKCRRIQQHLRKLKRRSEAPAAEVAA